MKAWQIILILLRHPFRTVLVEAVDGWKEESYGVGEVSSILPWTSPTVYKETPPERAWWLTAIVR
jgi:hypothetical protein